MNRSVLFRTILVSTAAQAAMVVAGHYSAAVRDNVFAVGGMGISLLAGLVYARLAAGSWASSLVGGLLAGGVCAFLGIGLSVFLGDVPPSLLAFGTVGSAVAGVIGGTVGRLVTPRAPARG